jgi:hypothetical protein
MVRWGAAMRIYLAPGATDTRKGFEGLGGMARDRLLCDPLREHVFLIRQPVAQPAGLAAHRAIDRLYLPTVRL